MDLVVYSFFRAVGDAEQAKDDCGEQRGPVETGFAIRNGDDL